MCRHATAFASALVLAACGEPTSPAPLAPADALALGTDPSTKKHFFFDQEQPLIDMSLTPLALYPPDPDPLVPGPFKQNLAQTFTPSADVELRYLYLPIACARGVRVRIQIRSGGPAGPVLHEANHNPDRIVAAGEFLNFQMGGGVPLTGGATYAFVLASWPTIAGETTCSIISGPPGNTYAGGDAYFNQPGFTPYWLPFSTFPGPEDLPFRTLVR